MAIGMAQIAGMIADTSQPILNDNVFRSIHRAQIYSFSFIGRKYTHFQQKNKIDIPGTKKRRRDRHLFGVSLVASFPDSLSV